jgi:hypothetical protein
MIELLSDSSMILTMTEKKRTSQKDKVLKSLKVIKNFVLDFEEPVKDKKPDLPKEK